MTAPERAALVKALRVHAAETREQFGHARHLEWMEQAADMIEALSAPAVTVTEEMVEAFLNRWFPEGWGDFAAEYKADCRPALEAALAISPRKSERDAVLEEAAQVLERTAVEAGRQECCGHYRGGDRFDDPPECCGDPDFVISNAVGAAAIRALKSTTPQTGS